MMNMRTYAVVTAAYWSFTITDGALRMLVLLYFHDLGYSPVSLALLFLLYEAFGVFTNLIGGWVGSRRGLRPTLIAGLALQVVALGTLSLLQANWVEWLAVLWVMGAQALSGIAKDLTKMSSKTAVKLVAPSGKLFGLVALLTGSKNALKGVGFFVGAALLASFGYRSALLIMAAAIAVVLVATSVLARDMGRPEHKPALGHMLKKSPEISRLALARFFLFGSRDIWFVVALPVFLDEELRWSFQGIGAFLAAWVIGYGIVQALAPRLLESLRGSVIGAYGFLPAMATIAIIIVVSIEVGRLLAITTVVGLLMFGVMFALTSSVHSYLILAYSKSDAEAAMDVGFYYSANALGRLVGTLLSGVLFLVGGFSAALVGTAVFLTIAFVLSLSLPNPTRATSGQVAAVAR